MPTPVLFRFRFRFWCLGWAVADYAGSTAHLSLTRAGTETWRRICGRLWFRTGYLPPIAGVDVKPRDEMRHRRALRDANEILGGRRG